MILKFPQDPDYIEILAAIQQSEEDIKAGRARPIQEFLQEIKQLLLDGIKSGEATPMTVQDWTEIRNEVRRRVKIRKEN